MKTNCSVQTSFNQANYSPFGNKFYRKAVRQSMSLSLKAKAFAQLPLSSQRIYWNILQTQQYSPTKTCYKKQETLGHQARVSLTTSHRQIKRLRSEGLLVTVSRRHNRSLLYYPVYIPDLLNLLKILTRAMEASITRFGGSDVRILKDIYITLNQQTAVGNMAAIGGGVPPDIVDLHHNKLSEEQLETVFSDKQPISGKAAARSSELLSNIFLKKQSQGQQPSERGSQYSGSDNNELLERMRLAKEKYAAMGGAAMEIKHLSRYRVVA